MTLLYANENFPLMVVQSLRDLGHDVLTSQEAGKANQSIPDEEVLAFAAQQRRALLTINRQDFIQLHKRSTLCDYNSETTPANNLVCRAEEKNHVSGLEW